MQVKNRILGIVKTATFNQSILTISATILSGILGLLFYILVARNLGPSSFGLFAVATATLALIADIGDLGTDTGLIRFIGKYIRQQNIQLKLLKLSLEVKLLIWFLVLTVGWLLTPLISVNIFQKEALIYPLRLAFIGVGGALLLSFTSHSLQAFQKFKIWSTILVSSNLVRLILIWFLIFWVGLNLQTALTTYILIPFAFFAVSLLFLPKFFAVNQEFSVFREFFKFNKWIFFLSIISAITSRIDIFLITRLLTIDQVGLYSAANQLTSFMLQLSFAIATVVAPKLARLQSTKELVDYFKKLQFFVLGLAVVGLLGIPIGYLIIQNLYGTSYQTSLMPFVILYFSQLIFLIALPSHQAIFYYFAKPKVFIPIVFAELLIVAILGFFLISYLGIIGAALAVLLGNLLLLIAPAFWVIREFKKR